MDLKAYGGDNDDVNDDDVDEKLKKHSSKCKTAKFVAHYTHFILSC